MNTHKITRIAIIAACLILAGCASTGAATPTATQPPQPPIPSSATIAPSEMPQSTAAPTATFTPQLIPTSPTKPPTPSLTPTSTRIPMPTATDYPAPAVPLSSTGPWLVFRADHYLWTINQDGTGLTRLTNEAVMVFAVQPTSSIQSGIEIAYASYNDEYESVIKLLSWPSGNVKTIVYNLSEWVEALSWSPGGSKLAFASAMGDINRNAFVYDSITAQTTRITASEVDVYQLRWSPDERYVIFETYYRGMAGPEAQGVWSARADAGGIAQLVNIAERQWIDAVEYLGWLSPTEIAVTFRHAIWGEDYNRDIRILNIETGNTTTLVSEPLLDVAYSPEHNLFLMTKDAPAPNTLLIFYQNGERREVTGYTIKYVEWLNAYNVFLGQTPDGRAYLITPDGTVAEISSPEWKVESDHHVIVSPDGQWWAWHSFGYDDPSDLWVGPAMAQPSALLAYSKVVPDYRVYLGDVKWSPDSRYLLWLTRKGLFVGQTPDFEATLVTQLPGEWGGLAGQKGSGAEFSNAVWVY